MSGTNGRGAATGASPPRVDARDKVTGAATYAAEHRLAGLVHAALVRSTIPRGRVNDIDAGAALRAPGVLGIVTHENAPRLRPFPDAAHGGWFAIETLLPLQDGAVHYAGQYIAAVVADTQERARHAAMLVRPTYEREPHTSSFRDARQEAVRPPRYLTGVELQTSRGDVAGGLAEAAATVDATYTTPMLHHNPMEPSATIAEWRDGTVTVYESTQGVVATRDMVAAVFGLAPESVRVIARFVGGGFGAKVRIWPHTLIAIMASRTFARPVEVALTRPQMYTGSGHRPPTEQRVVLGASSAGRLTAMRHVTTSQTSRVGDFIEPCGTVTQVAYACPNVEVEHHMVRVDTSAPAPMRGPGESTGTFALESAMDELSYELGLDPLDVRLANIPWAGDPQLGKPWTSLRVDECYRRGAEAFGWSRRSRPPRSMRDGDELVGYGMATATYPAKQTPAAARATIDPDGMVTIATATQEIGTGTATILGQVAAEVLGVPVGRVRCVMGDSRLPPGPLSGGSMTAASAGSAVHAAATALRERILGLALGDAASPLCGLGVEEVHVADGRLFLRADPAVGETCTELLGRHGTSLEAEGVLRRSIGLGDVSGQPHSCQSFGAQFVEARVDEQIGRARVVRALGVFDVGRVLNARTARSQAVGGMIFGLGMALLERTHVDPRSGRIVSADLAEYHVPVSADVPDMEVVFLDRPDPHMNELGVRGLGELGTTGAAAAVANAVYHATGRRVRDLPIQLDNLL